MHADNADNDDTNDDELPKSFSLNVDSTLLNNEQKFGGRRFFEKDFWKKEQTGEKKPMKELSAKKNVYKSVTWVSGGPDSRVLIEGSTSTVQQRLRICDGGRLTCPVAPDDDLNYKRPLYDSKVIVRMEELKGDLMLNSLKMRR